MIGRRSRRLAVPAVRHTPSARRRGARHDGLALAAAVLCHLLPAAAAASEEEVARGRYLAVAVATCLHCHTPLGDKGPDMAKALAGGRRFEEAEFTVFSSNITPDPETGIGRWSDAELAAAIVDGVRPDGTPLAPIMPSASYRAMLPEDVAAVIAYLRAAAPVRKAVPPPDYRAALPVPHAPPGFASPPSAEEIATPAGRGRYLVAIARCMTCHDRPGTDTAAGYGAGGAEFEGPWGVSVAANITSSATAGIGAWSDAEIRRAIAEGIGRDGRKLKPPMAYRAYAGMTATDLDAVVAYLRTIPPAE